MHRVRHQREAEAIAAAFDMLPDGLAERLSGTHFLTGVDPGLAGLHRFRTNSVDGRSYADTPHVAWRMHQEHLSAARRATTIVVPVPTGWSMRPETIIHELGHVLDEQLDFGEDAHTAVSEYAQRCRYEAFAESFKAWVCPWDQSWPTDPPHPADVALFELLSA